LFPEDFLAIVSISNACSRKSSRILGFSATGMTANRRLKSCFAFWIFRPFMIRADQRIEIQAKLAGRDRNQNDIALQTRRPEAKWDTEWRGVFHA
jgi:hypothetical protein